MTDWDARWLNLCENIATWSKDKSTKVGCVIVGNSNQVLSLGYNGFPRGVNDDVPERHERPEKYKWTEHSERNAIYNAARTGVKLEGATLYVPCHPCCDCTRAIIQAGIRKVVIGGQINNGLIERWGSDFMISDVMLTEAGVEVEERLQYV